MLVLTELENKKLHPGCADLEMADCHRCPTTVVEMANSLIGYNTNRLDRKLTKIDSKGAGEVIITQQANPDAEAGWIANKVKGLLDKGVLANEIIVLVQRKKAGKRIVPALKKKEIPSKSYYDESQLDAEGAQWRFALFKLLLNKDDRVALRYLIGAGTATFRSGLYGKLRAHCEESGDSPWQALEKLSDGTLSLKNMSTLVASFEEVRSALIELAAKEADLTVFVDAMFPADDPDIEELRELALDVVEHSKTTKELLKAMMEEMTQPDIPPVVEDVRLMSLHKSKGLSSPYVFIAGCVQGVLPQMPKQGTPKVESDADLEEARRLFFVGITRVKAEPENGRPGSLFISYPKEMNAGAASGEKVAFQHVVYGQAQLLPSIFIQELGPAAPNPV
jgi:ATP-dependent DNA helicase UvrD/PcrA